jgi:3-(3-hydroxy-phenyl)propionate hydroxylase
MSVDVCIVGGGPTGLLMANLLGRAGVDVLLVEQNATTSSDAKAISIDGESLRTMQRAGLLEDLRAVVLPGTGTFYFGADGRPLIHARGPRRPLHGHPIKSPFAQPDFERVLHAGLARHTSVEAAFSTRFIGARQDADGVDVELEGRGERCRFLIACDGGRSPIRELLGISMSGRSYRDPWIVIDTVGDGEDHRYGMHHGDPGRPFVVIPGGRGRCRYEFLLHPGEAPASFSEPPFELVHRLLAPHRTIRPDQVERVAVYRFHALNADRWQDGRIFLAGDAAHMMPPFAGQGLNSGVRDVNNLSWKLAEVLTGRAGDELLATYEAERRPHAQSTIDLSTRLGSIVMTTRASYARARDALVRTLARVGPARRYLEEMRYVSPQRYRDGFVVPGELAGGALPQPDVLAASGAVRRLDDVLGDGFALLAVELADAAVPGGELWGRLAPRLVRVLLDDRFPREDDPVPTVADYDRSLREWLAPFSGRYVLVRPDRFVAAAFAPGEADAVARRLAATWVTRPEPVRA